MLLTSTFHVVMAALMAAAAIALLVVAARRGALLPVRQRAALLATRAGMFGLVVLAALDPMARHQQTHRVPPRVVVLLDASKSMSIRDARGGPTRWEQATALLGRSGSLGRLLERADPRTYSFGEEMLPWDPRAGTQPDGPATDIASALREGVRDAGPDVAAVLILTDGQDSTGATADRIAEAAGMAPVYAVGVGAEKPPADVQVLTLAAPRSIPAGERGVVAVTIFAPGFEGQSIQVAFHDGERETKRSVTVGESGHARLKFPVEFKDIGLRRCRVSVAPQEGELTTLNNARTAFVPVTQGKRHILWVDRPRQEFAAIKRALVALPNAEVDVFLHKGAGPDFRQEAGDASRKAKLPSGARLAAYDAIVIGDVRAKTLGAEFMREVAELVRRKGVGLGVLGGPRALGVGGYADTPIGELLPLSLGRLDGYRPGGFKLRPEIRAATHPLLQITADAAAPVKWSELPYLDGVNETRGPKPGAQVLLQGVAPGRPAESVATAQRAGAGKVFCFASDATWRWALSDASTERSAQIHRAFWRHAFIWLATRTNDRAVRLAVDKDVCPVGIPVRIIADVSGSDFAPVADADVTAQVAEPASTKRKLQLRAVATAPGRYEATYRPSSAGDYAIAATAQRGGRRIGEDETEFTAQEAIEEYRSPTLNRPLLEALARRTGGEFVRADEAERLAALLDLAPKTVRSFTFSRWTRAWPFLVGFILVAGIDWGLRRRWGAG